jgi:hypothetical protein
MVQHKHRVEGLFRRGYWPSSGEHALLGLARKEKLRVVDTSCGYRSSSVHSSQRLVTCYVVLDSYKTV